MTVDRTRAMGGGSELLGPERRRRWSVTEKVAMVEQTYEPGMTVSLVARRNGVAANQLFRWRKLYREGALTSVGSGDAVVPASEFSALEKQVRELQRLLGKKTLENEILKEAVEVGRRKKYISRAPLPGDDDTR